METAKNAKLQVIHDSLIQIRDLQVRQAEMKKMSGGQEEQNNILIRANGDLEAAGGSDPSQIKVEEGMRGRSYHARPHAAFGWGVVANMAVRGL